ncbi:NDP-sugar synthase [Sphingobacterium sp. SGR-19]|uniref:nucleotidyltransferase family protein n=1 Tax=Sphingobacterium sp. SGR-19 TaxID=2710886 RepID=UPI0013EA99FA|nr:sugar phosphate nucleotidyltransferase [Sphingobacterium sp. SGR-19]NGM65806.1 nucleotidyltransferase [Sphingobacterium sp. SGR-19]
MLNKRPTLVILAAGMASRYGSAKQVDGFGPNQEKIIDYSIYDAIRAGFGKVVFVIREEFLDIMKENFDDKLRGKIEVAYAFQDFNLRKFGIDLDIERQKPWGTGHAVMSAEQEIDGPFCVINADDFYGYEAFEKMSQFLQREAADDKMAMVGFEVGKTLSDYGYVSRGVCDVDQNGYMRGVTERTNIYRRYNDQEEHIVYEEHGTEHELAPDARVSMNFWGFTPKVLEVARALFPDFVEKHKENPKAEFFIPDIPDYMVKQGMASCAVLPTSAKWFGVTYKEDKEVVKESIAFLVANGAYPPAVWEAKKQVDASLYLDF